jgi:predicted O-methyltransferase YrrM
MTEAYTDRVKQYIRELFASDDGALRRSQESAEVAGLPGISIGPEEGRFLQLVAMSTGARRALEIGTLAGYSGIWIARGLPTDGTLVTLELDEKHAEVARQSFAEAGLSHMVDVRVGPALKTLEELQGEEPFDLVFIDADKTEYPDYLEGVLKLTQPGSMILAHNVFMKGKVVDEDRERPVEAVREFNRLLAEHPALESTLIPLRDGMSLTVVREVREQ